ALHGRGFSMPDLSKALEGTSHITVKDGKNEGVNLLQEAISLLKVAGISLDNPKATVCSAIETDLVVKELVVNDQRPVIDSHEFRAMGSRTIGLHQTINRKTTLTPSQHFSQKSISSSAGFRIALNEGRLDLPFLIKGPTQVPSYGLDSKALEGKVQEQV